jgi:hypothetical protein
VGHTTGLPRVSHTIHLPTLLIIISVAIIQINALIQVESKSGTFILRVCNFLTLYVMQ